MAHRRLRQLMKARATTDDITTRYFATFLYELLYDGQSRFVGETF